MRVTDNFSKRDERVNVLGRMLEPFTEYTYFKAKKPKADGRTLVEFCMKHVEDFAGKAGLRKRPHLAEALRSKTQNRSDHWLKHDLWVEFVDNLRDMHDNGPYFMPEWETDDYERAEYIRCLIESSDQLLFLNLGGISQVVYDEKTAATFRRLVKRSSPMVLLTFGWPRQKGETDFSHLDPTIRELSKIYNKKRATKIVEANPFLKEVVNYGESEKGKGRVVIVALRERIENHFAMSFRSRGENDQYIDMGVEVLHNERKHIRRMLNPVVPRAVCLQAGIVLNHLVNIGIAEKRTKNSGNIWFTFD